jgi:outer membrane protein OmpA-like peptidoglycan-associated protein
VKGYLVAHGILPQRLLAVGFGGVKPIADNATAEGRAKNGRIEFYIAEFDGAREGVDLTGGGRVFE